MRSRTFLHVSLGILALAAAYHLGARSAGAQASCGELVDIVRLRTPGCEGLVTMNTSGQAFEGCGGSWHPTWSLPGTPVALLNGPGGAPELIVLMNNGDVYQGITNTSLGSWPPVLVGNVCPGGPTPARQESMGAVKARYR